MGKQLSGAQKRKKKKEKEEAAERARAEMERLKLGPTKIWTGLVTHHKDVFVSHVLPKLNRADRWFFSEVSSESFDQTFAQSANLRAMPSTSASAPAATTTTTAGSSTQASTSAECFENFRCDVCGEMSSQLGCLKADYRRKHEWGSDPDYRYYSDKVCYSWENSTPCRLGERTMLLL